MSENLTEAAKVNAAPRTASTVTFQDLWNLLDEERERAAILKSDHLAHGHANTAAHFAKRELGFEKLQKWVGRISQDDEILQPRLAELARIEAEREAALDAAANPDKDKPE